MAVFRIEKKKDYTVMLNHHLRNKELSLKLSISDNRKKCAICGKLFISSANKAKYCNKCKIIAIRKKKAEYQRKYRSRVEK